MYFWSWKNTELKNHIAKPKDKDVDDLDTTYSTIYLRNMAI